MMRTVLMRQPDNPDEFRRVARGLLAGAIDPADVAWASGTDGTLFGAADLTSERSVYVPRSFSTLADAVICHRSEQRWPLLYEALWRIDRGERSLMERHTDKLVHRLHQMAAEIRRDQHRMTAFIRFRIVPHPDGDYYIAWYEPRHRVLRRAASFFVDRFASMRFSILTPDLTMHWDQGSARFGPGLRRDDAVSNDAVEGWWRRYYAAVFNPARSNARLMQSHMPKRFWRDLPEASVITELLNAAGSRTEHMIRPSGDSSHCGAVAAKPLF